MIKVVLVCDSCRAVIAEGISANEMRLEAQDQYRRHEGKDDLCLACDGAVSRGGKPASKAEDAG